MRKDIDRISVVISDYKKDYGTGKLSYGVPGSGKSTLLCKMVKVVARSLVLCFTNKACQNIFERLQDYNIKVKPFHSYFCEWYDEEIWKDVIKVRTISVDEYSMVPQKWMTNIYEIYCKYKNTIYMFGDENQCDPVEDGSQIHYDYLHCSSISQMRPEKISLQYKQECSQYDKRTNLMLEKLLRTN